MRLQLLIEIKSLVQYLDVPKTFHKHPECATARLDTEILETLIYEYSSLIISCIKTHLYKVVKNHFTRFKLFIMF